jgi:hypothetical protein
MGEDSVATVCPHCKAASSPTFTVSAREGASTAAEEAAASASVSTPPRFTRVTCEYLSPGVLLAELLRVLEGHGQGSEAGNAGLRARCSCAGRRAARRGVRMPRCTSTCTTSRLQACRRTSARRDTRNTCRRPARRGQRARRKRRRAHAQQAIGQTGQDHARAPQQCGNGGRQCAVRTTGQRVRCCARSADSVALPLLFSTSVAIHACSVRECSLATETFATSRLSTSIACLLLCRHHA